MKLPRFLSIPTDGVARASAPAGPADGTAVPTDADSILGIALDVGAELLRCGGEVHRVEDTVTRICRAYGAEAVEVFAITSLIIAEVRMPNGDAVARTRRVLSSYNHLSRLEAFNALSRTVCAQPMPAAEVTARISAIRRYRPVPEWLCYLGAMLATGGFAVFFGGTLWDGAATAVIALVVTLLSHLAPLRLNGMVKSLLASFTAGVLAILCVSLGFGENADKIMIGTIMLEIPGLSFGNALRDLLCGDTLAGTLRFIQAVLQALMIAMGYMAAHLLLGQLIGGVLG